MQEEKSDDRNIDNIVFSHRLSRARTDACRLDWAERMLESKIVNTGEREYPTEKGTLNGIEPNHIARYQFTSQYVKKGTSVCDVACGCGYGSLILSEAGHYTGIDLSEETVLYAQECYGNLSRTFRRGDILDPASLGFGIYDTIISFETVEHVLDPNGLFLWARDRSKTFICSTPIDIGRLRSPFHKKEYGIEEFRVLLERYWRHVTLYTQNGSEITPLPFVAGDVVMAVCTNKE